MKQRMGNKKRFTAILLGVLLVLSLGLVKLYRTLDVKYPWLWMYLTDTVKPSSKTVTSGPKHVMFLFVDHFEPHEQNAMDSWMKGYPKMASKHLDSDGKHPQHSWFWFFSQSDLEEKKSFLTQLANLVYRGYGEIELHMHHGNDNEESFLKQMNEAIMLSKEVGAMVSQETQPRQIFAFIHGMWGLDNSRGIGYCGVNNELILLRKLGCYADFTNPSWGSAHSRMVNRLYYATDDSTRPKSHDTGTVMEVGKPGIGDLLMFTGQSVVGFKDIKPSYDHGEVDHEYLPTPERIDSWVKKAISVKGRPEWVFIKVFSHGALAQDHDVMLGDWADRLYSHLEKHYNDGSAYVLHYVTAREAYNIAKAAEAGKQGNPSQYRDFLIPPYVNRFISSPVPYETISMSDDKAVIRFLVDPGSHFSISLHASQVSVSGDAVVRESKETNGETMISLGTKGGGVVGFTFKRSGTGDASTIT